MNEDAWKKRRLKQNAARRYQYRIQRKERFPKTKECEICGCVFTPKQLAQFDHCHITGIHRGWLCYRCNTMLSLATDSITRLIKAIKYLERFHKLLEGKPLLKDLLSNR